MIKNAISEQVTKINLIFIFNLISLLVLIINNTSSPIGYVISLYSYYPIYFWILYILIIYFIILGLLVFNKNGTASSDRYIILYLFSILLVNFIFLSLPILQGFQYGRGDSLTHLGIIKDILSRGFVSKNNWFPLLHIFTTQFCHITGISYIILSNVIPPLFNLGSIMFIFLIARMCSENKNSIFSLIFLTVPLYLFFNLDFAPSNEAFLIFPLFVFCLLKTNFKETSSDHISFNIIVVILLFYTIFSHPEIPIFSILVYLVIMFLKKDSSILNLLFLTGVIFLYWSFDFSAFNFSINKLYNLVFIGWTSSAFNQIEVSSQRANLSLLDIMKEILFTYGYFICIVLIVIILCSYLFLSTKKMGKRNDSITLFFYLYIGFSLISLVFLLSDFIISYSRIFKFWTLFGVLFVGVTLEYLDQSTKFKLPKLLFLIILLLLFVSVIFNTFEVYNSPITRTFNDQITKNEIIGMTWFFDYRNDKLIADDIWIRQDRFFNLIFGQNITGKNIRNLGMGNFPPDHFDYDYDNKSINNRGRYLIWDKLSKYYYPMVYPQYKNLWRFDFEDFQNLEMKNEIFKIYSNGEFEINYINL